MIGEFVDHLFRFGAICNLAWIVFLAASNHSKLAPVYVGIPAAVASMCFLVTGAYDEIDLFGGFGHILGFVARMTIVLSWLFVISFFSDDFRMPPIYTGVLAVYFVRALVIQLDIVAQDVMANFSHAMMAGLYIFLVCKVLFERSDDLLEKRRRLRIYFMIWHILFTVTVLLERKLISNTLYADHISLIESLGIFLVSAYLLFVSIRPQERYPLEERFEKSLFHSADEVPSSKLSILSAADKHNLKLLGRKMKEGLYREPGLTVAKLSDAIDIPEHRLRKLINSHLGHRNISQFLNQYRILEAKRRLADANERHVPILTIAMEAGYVSLRPFNRAFKDRTGKTPSEYREENLMAKLIPM
tara:strand:- start:1387 stop:2463 length:1077 start_codon:yes stop_codon:yes gene_type:complete